MLAARSTSLAAERAPPARSAAAARAVPASVRRAVSRPGRALPDHVRRLAGPGADFAAVRVHDDVSAREVHADAYALGNHVVFAPGRYAPDTRPGMRLLVHELAHVAQQRQAVPAPPAPDAVGPTDDPAEREAAATADAVVERGRPAAQQLGAIAGSPAPANVVRCQRLEGHPDPHYPTEEEQKDIERILRRKREVARPPGAPAAPAPAAGQPAQTQGRVLAAAEVTALAARLQGPLLEKIKEAAGGPAPAAAIGADAAFDAVEDARKAVYKEFGDYVTRTITLTRDETATAEARKAANQVLIQFTDTGTLGPTLVRTIAATDCATCAEALDGLADESRTAVMDAVVASLQASNAEDLRKAALATVGGVHRTGTDEVNIPLGPRAKVYETAVHELIHSLTHPVFTAAFRDEKNIIEGFTEYFTMQIVTETHSAYGKVAAAVSDVHSAMKGPFASRGGKASEESLRRAYFGGELELIGWVPSGPQEEALVKAAGGAKAWSAETAKTYAERYKAEAIEAQDPHRNVLGVGLFFQTGQGRDPTVGVRYTRVLRRTEPYARGQFLAEGQLLGAPFSDPKTFAASIGLAAEYQEPYFFLTGGGRFVGTAAQGGGNKLDFSPFAGGGIRAWQTIRVGVEGFAVVPLTGGDWGYGVGATVGLEFK
jgi:hypothetical protein